MYYVVEYDVCALLFLIVIMGRFFPMRRFPNRQNRLFGATLVLALIDLALDIASSYTIFYANRIPGWLNYLVNMAFLTLQLALPVLMFYYMIVVAGVLLSRRQRFLYLVLPAIPAGLLMLVLLSTPFTGLIFRMTEVNGAVSYVHGPWFLLLYISGACYGLLTFIFTLYHRDHLRKRQYFAILWSLLVILTAILIQAAYPNYLLTGAAIVISILIMFFSLYNPETMLDLISGLYNYSALTAFLDDRLQERRTCWLIAIDIAGIRHINSSFGIHAGNELLQQVGDFFHQLGADVWSFRMIGTRLLIVVPTAERCQEVIRHARQRFSGHWPLNGRQVSLLVTIRYFEATDFFQTPEDIINLIDVAYADIGPNGLGSVKSIHADLLQQTRRQQRVESAIRRALMTGTGFELYYQPLFDVMEKSFHYAEALLRLNSPELGRISPAEFIPVAERTGLIFPIDELVISMACDFLRRSAEGDSIRLDTLAVNLSAAELFQDSSHSLLQKAVRGNGIPPQTLCFEVTETAAAVHHDVLAKFMDRLIGEGYRFALDDFGTGFANLSQVAKLPFAVIKLDPSLLFNLDERSSIFFEDLLRMFARMGLQTVVEGVETAEQAARVNRIGSDYIQGFYYARPMPEAEFLAFMCSQSATGLTATADDGPA